MEEKRAKLKPLRLLGLWLLMLLVLLTTGCGGDSSTTKGGKSAKMTLIKNDKLQTVDVGKAPSKSGWLQSVKPAAKKPYTVMIYMNGTDLETEGGCATGDLKEMLASGWDDSRVNLVLLTGGTKKWDNKVIRSKETMVYQITQKGFHEEVSFAKASIGKAATLSNFVAYATKAYPAEQTALVFWNHGGGPINGYGSDELHKGESLELPDIYKALKESGLPNKGLSFLGFDACLMASVENAFMLKDFAHYMVASEESEPGTGWNYAWLKALSDSPGQKGDQIGKSIVDLFIEACEENDTDATLSVISLDKITDFAAAFEQFGAASQNALVRGSYNDIAKARAKAKSFGYSGKGEYNFDLVDIYHLASRSKELAPQQAEALMQAVKDIVVYNKTTKEIKNAYGIMTYLPYATKEAAMPQSKFYKSLGLLKPYASFLELYSKKMNGRAIPRDAIVNVAPTLTPKGEVYLQLSPQQLTDLDKARFVIWRQMEKGSDYYIQLGMSSKVKIAKDGKIDTRFDGYWTTLEGQPLCLYEVERTADRVKYSAPVQYKGQHGNLLVVTDKANKDGRIVGYVPPGLKEGKIASKNIIKLQKGDKLIPEYYAELFLKNKAEAGTRQKAKWVQGKELTLKGDKLSVKPVDDQLYLYGFWITDTMGNDYYTRFIEIKY